MASDFVGLTILVKLKNPPTVLQGLVAAVQNQRLRLCNVLFPATGKKLTDYIIHGAEIEDIEVLPTQDETTTEHAVEESAAIPFLESQAHEPPVVPQMERLASPKQLSPAFPIRHTSLRPAQVLPPKNFVDPAILSYARRSSKELPATIAPRLSTSITITQTTTPYPTDAANEPIAEVPGEIPPILQHHQHQQYPHHQAQTHHHLSRDPTKQTYDYLLLDNETRQLEQEEVVVTGENYSSRANSTTAEMPRPAIEMAGNELPANGHVQKKRRQRPASKKREIVNAISAADNDPGNDTSPVFARKALQPVTHPDGWRQTPILESPMQQQTQPGAVSKHQTASYQRQPVTSNAHPPYSSTINKTVRKAQRQRQRRMDREAQENGWATEDATDVQDLGEFDFAGNLDKFDKAAVFSQLRDADTTADDDRLVSFNKNSMGLGTAPKARPGTFGGRNLHPTEMVLEPEDMEEEVLMPEDPTDLGMGAFAVSPDMDGILAKRPAATMPMLPHASDAVHSSDDDDLNGNGNGTGSLTSSRILRQVRSGSRVLALQQQHGSHPQQPSSRKSSAAVPPALPLDHLQSTHMHPLALETTRSHRKSSTHQPPTLPPPIPQSCLPYPHVSDDFSDSHSHSHYQHQHRNSRGGSLAEDAAAMQMSMGNVQMSPHQHLMIPAEPGQGWLLSETLERLEKLALSQKRIAEDMLRLVEGVREGIRGE